MKTLRQSCFFLLGLLTVLAGAIAYSQVGGGGLPANPTFSSVHLRAPSTGTFTMTIGTTGCSATNTVSVTYYVINRTVHMELGTGTCTGSGGTVFGFSGIPAAIRPISNHFCGSVAVENIANATCICTINSTGTGGFTFPATIGAGATGFAQVTDIVYGLD